MKKSTIMMVAALVAGVVIGAGGGFFGGMKYQQNQRFMGQRQFQGQFQGNQNGRMMGFRPVSGEILSVDDKSITVKLADGSSRIVFLSDQTTINKAETASKSALTKGEKVMVTGTLNSDGSVTAQTVSLGK